jgi:hypothetical protein
MGLSSDLISQFVKVTNDDKKTKDNTTVYGTIKVDEDTQTTQVQIDGSSTYTPVDTTVDVHDGDRVIVTIKDHFATVTGNLTSPAAKVQQVTILEEQVSKKISAETGRLETLISERVSTEELEVETGKIEDLIATKVDTETFTTETANIKDRITANAGDIILLKAKDATIEGTLEANEAAINDLTAKKLSVTDAVATYATITNLNNTRATIEELVNKKLSAEDAAITYANIDFSNIGKAAMEYLYSTSGLIDNVVIGDGTITGELVGVTIRGDLIESNTVIADKLVIKGDDGLYYKLNTDGVTTEAEQSDYNSLNGQIIRAKSITATQISVSDLVAFDATIGGFNISENSISSEVKDSAGNTTRGIYMDMDGQMNFGDGKNYVKYFKDTDGTYKLAISAATILYDINGSQHSIADIGAIGEYVKIGTYEGEPSIELGETDSDFKMIITNTKILFMEGSGIPAYVSNQSLYIKKAVIEEELQQGGFMWKVRSNGNMGLIWTGASIAITPDNALTTADGSTFVTADGNTFVVKEG